MKRAPLWMEAIVVFGGGLNLGSSVVHACLGNVKLAVSGAIVGALMVFQFACWLRAGRQP